MSLPSTVRKTSIRLADGRELIYYDDEHPDADRSMPDRRDPSRIETRSELRRDPLLDEWVAVASHRQDRTYLPPPDECPLDPSTPGRLTEIPAPDYDVVVFENRFPSLALDVDRRAGRARGPAPGQAAPDGTGQAAPDGLVPRRPGIGRCEVVCFTSDHDGALGRLPASRVRTVVDVWADRTVELGAMPGIEQVFPFENRGEEIGVTLHHPHGQIYAYPFVAPRTARQLVSAARWRAEHGGCLYCAVIDSERSARARVLGTAGGWVAFVPEAARWPFEVHLYPTRHLPDLPALDGGERDGLVAVLGDVLRRFDGLFDRPMPYMLAWHQAPVRRDRDLAHLHLEVFSIRRSATKLKYLAASESGAGVFINDVAPERAAELLREASA